MTWYPLLVFVHVLAAIGMFAAWGVEALLLQRLRNAGTADAAGATARQLAKLGRVTPAAMFVILASGITMMTRWGHQAWMSAAFVAVIVIGAIGGVIGRRAGRRMATALAGEASRAPAEVASAAGSLAVALQLRVAIGVGIIGLMTMKPGPEGSLLILGVAAAAGLAVAARQGWGNARRSRPVVTGAGATPS